MPLTWPGSEPITYRTRRPCTRRAGARQPRGRQPRASRAYASGGVAAAARDLATTGVPGVTDAGTAGAQSRPCRSAGCAPAATRSATAAFGSRPVTSDSPTSTASAPALA